MKDENSVKLSDVTGIADNNDEDNQEGKETLEIVMPPDILNYGLSKGPENNNDRLPKKKQGCSKKSVPFFILCPELNHS